MNNQPFKISQGYEVLIPKSGKAYPVLCDEWNFLKEKINNISLKNEFFNDAAWTLFGFALSTIGTLLFGLYQDEKNSIIAVSIVVGAVLIGLLCLYFSKQVKDTNKIQASDVVTQMELIERRYQIKEYQLEKPENLPEFLIQHSWILIFRPPDHQKIITFNQDGSIQEGQNQNENRWRIKDGKLELIQQDGKTHSRFIFDVEKIEFNHTNDPDTPSQRNQIIKLKE